MLPFERSDRLNRAIGATYRFQRAVCFFKLKLQAASSSAGAGNKSHHEDRAPHPINHPLPRRFTTSASASFRFQSHSTFTHSAQVPNRVRVRVGGRSSHWIRYSRSTPMSVRLLIKFRFCANHTTPPATPSDVRVQSFKLQTSSWAS